MSAGAGPVVAAVVPAAGRGERLGGGEPKALLPLGGQPMLAHSVRTLAAGRVDLVVVAAPSGRVDEVAALLADAGFTLEETHAVRVFADLVPGSLLDLEPGATAALVDLERAVAGRPEYLPLATQVHLLATR